MAQAFEIPTGNRIATGRDAPAGVHLNEFPDTLSRSPLPAGPDPIRWIDNSNMGLPSARRKRTNIGQTRPAAGPIPGSAIPARLINPV